MTDRDRGSAAWHVTPADYHASRSKSFGIPSNPESVYVPMRDGCRLAVDVYLPQPNKAGAGFHVPAAKFPSILIFTPYYRRFRLAASGAEPSPNAAKYRDTFVPCGYALVVIDVRGTGASFGTRDALRSPKERDDSYEIAEWIVREHWSDGNIGATGISYLGAAACFLASTGHPAVKAIAPLFAVSDIYSEQLYPGGLLSQIWCNAYDDLMIALDQDRRDLLKDYVYFADPRFAGPQPVDDDPDGAMLEEALRGHLENFRMRDLAREFFYRDSATAHDTSLTSAACSPYGYLETTRPEVAILSVSGWCDGAGYANGSIARYLTLRSNPQRLLLGPWDHGARINVSPWRSAAAPEFALMGELVRFFDRYLMHLDNGLDREAPIHYFSIHGETWHSAEAWPPDSRDWLLHATPALTLVESAADNKAGVDYPVTFTTTTGHQTRYERLGAANVEDYYPDWAERSTHMLHFQSAPAAGPVEITGHAVARLRMASSQPDASIFVYLSEIEPDGRVHYITEGMLRLLHRSEREAPPDYRTSWPFHSYEKADARLMTPGEAETVTIALLPVSWTLAAGSRLRISISGADAQHYPQVPHGRPPRFTFATGGADGTRFVIPVRTSGAATTSPAAKR